MILRLLLIVAFIYLLRILFRNYFARPYREGYQERAQANQKAASRKSEGKVSIFTNGAGKTHDDKQIGEYVDYEEVKDEDKK